MNFFKTSILAISFAALAFGFASCSDDDDPAPTVLTKTEWTVKETTSEVKSENPETVTAIEAKINESPSIMKSIILFSSGAYELTLNNSKEKGQYEMKNDSLKLTVQSTMEAGNTLRNRAYAITKGEDKLKMKLTEDITNEFKNGFEDVDQVLVTFDLEGVNSVVAEPY